MNVRGPCRMEKLVRGSADRNRDVAKLAAPNATAVPSHTTATRRVILPGDWRLTAPKTRVGATRNPATVARRTTTPFTMLHPGGKAIARRPTARNSAVKVHAHTHHRLNSWRRS